jgi:hypothetical protein
MNKLKICPILLSLLSFFLIVSVGWAADLSIENKITMPSDQTIWTSDSKESPREANVALTLTNIFVADRPPMDIILAIDGSGSLIEGDGADPNRLRVVAAQQFVNNLDATKDRVGVVHWNDTVVGTPLALTSDFIAAKEYLNLSDAKGYTSIWKALNASAYLLKSARPNAKKVIILFSDGMDTSKPLLDFKGLAGQIKQSGVQIYTIGLGASNIADLEAIGKYYHVTEAKAISSVFDDVAADILGSLDNVHVKYIIPRDLELFAPSENLKIAPVGDGQAVTWDIGSMIPKKSKTLSFKVRSQNIGVYPLGMAPNSIVTYTKADGTSGTQAVPSAEINVKGDGRFFYKGDGKGGSVDGQLSDSPLDNQYKLSVDKSIQMPSDGGCQDIVIDVKTPLIPCNNTVIFALDSSGSTMQSHLEDVMMDEIEVALRSNPNMIYARVDWDAGANGIIPLTSGIDYSGPFRRASDWRWEKSNPPLFCAETEATIYETGLGEAVAKMDKRMGMFSCFAQKTNSWSIIFITGESEFDRGTGFNGILDYAARRNISIYPIGVQLDPVTAGEEIAALEEISRRTGTRPYFINDPDLISDTINEILIESCKVVSSRSIAKDVVLTESVYPYFRVIGTNIAPVSKQVNNDGTTTLVWNIGDMRQSQLTRIVINTALDLSKLPVDVTDKKTAVSYNPSSTTPSSLVTYKPICGPDKPPIPLPEGELSIFCGEPCSSPKVSQAPVVEQINIANTTKTTAPVDVKKQPGFEALVAILGLIAMACVSKRG